MKNNTLLFIKYGLFSGSIIFASLFLFSQPTLAASLLFSSSIPDGHVGLHQMFKVSVKLDPEGEVINSLETRIFYPHDLLKLSGIEDGSSFISMWLERAHEENGVISLSGIVPRGFNGNISDLEYSKFSPGDVVTLTFEPIKAGTAVIGVSSSTALLNDGLGTKASLKYGSATISIGDYINNVVIDNTDVTSPDFTYAEAHYDTTLGGQYLFFVASDKDSGIDHYEIKDGDIWRIAQSPYLITQDVGVYYIKAIDRAGNEKIKEIQTPVSSNTFSSLILWLVVIALVFLVVWRILIKKNKKY
jgi:hypothetical protein